MSGGGPETTTQTTAPPAYVQPYLERLAQEASVLQQSGSLAPVAGQNATQRQANQAALGYIYDPSTTDYLTNLRSANQNLINAPDLNNNPYINDYIKANADAITRSYNEQILPGITSEAVQTGGVGGSRQGVAQGLAAGRTSEAVANSTSDILNQAYLSGLSAQAKGLALAPSTLGAPLDLFGAAQRVGQNEQQQEQLQLDAPARSLQRLGELLGLSTGGGGTTTQTSQTSEADAFNNTVGTILSFASFFI